MSAGHVHTKASIILAGGFIVGGIILHDPSSLLYASGCLIGVMVSPDQDVDSGNVSNKYLRTRIGRWADHLWRGLWYMYRRSLKHGSKLSHFPLISTIGRLSYLYLMLVFIPHVLIYFIFSPQWNMWDVLSWYAGWGITNYKIILGLMSADTIHYFLDLFTKN